MRGDVVAVTDTGEYPMSPVEGGWALELSPSMGSRVVLIASGDQRAESIWNDVDLSRPSSNPEPSMSGRVFARLGERGQLMAHHEVWDGARWVHYFTGRAVVP